MRVKKVNLLHDCLRKPSNMKSGPGDAETRVADPGDAETRVADPDPGDAETRVADPDPG